MCVCIYIYIYIYIYTYMYTYIQKDHIYTLKIMWSKSKFGGLWKHQINPACTESTIVFKILKLQWTLIQKKEEHDKTGTIHRNSIIRFLPQCFWNTLEVFKFLLSSKWSNYLLVFVQFVFVSNATIQPIEKQGQQLLSWLAIKTIKSICKRKKESFHHIFTLLYRL